MTAAVGALYHPLVGFQHGNNGYANGPRGQHPEACVSGLVVEWLPATESARVRFPAHADFSCQWRLSAPLAQWLARWTSNPKVAGSSPAGGSRGEVAERSKALRQGRNLFGGVGSNPTLVTFSRSARQSYPSG